MKLNTKQIVKAALTSLTLGLSLFTLGGNADASDAVPAAAPKQILMVVASPTPHPTLNFTMGFWGAELTHPYYAFTEAGYKVDIASPKGGKVTLDAFSDPRDASGYSAHDLITMGFLNTPKLAALLENTLPISKVNAKQYDAIVVAGGQAPMMGFKNDPVLQKLVADFYQSGKITAALCHGVSSLLDVKLNNGTYLVEGKTITGFANIEEDYVDNYLKTRLFDWRIEDYARNVRKANYLQAGLYRPFAVRDGTLITGQQQNSGGEVAKLVIEALGR